MFQLSSKLLNDTFPIGMLSLNQVRLMNNALFPWIILIPSVENAVEITDLSRDQQILAMDEISQTTSIIQKIYSPDKMNIATLGNQVSQLHFHVIARFKDDEAWPNPVWGQWSKHYDEKLLNEVTDVFKNAFSKYDNFSPAKITETV